MPNILASVKAIIKDNDNFLIIEQEFNWKVYSDLPWWRIEYSESPYFSLIREVREEVFLDIEITKALGIWRFFKNNKDQVICYTFLCKSKNKNIDLTKNPADENIINYKWLTKEEILKIENFQNNSIKNIFDLI